MKNLIFSLILIFYFSNFLISQQVLTLDDRGEWDVSFEIPDSLINQIYYSEILLDGHNAYKAEVVDKKLQFIFPSQLLLYENTKYTFQGVLYLSNGIILESKTLKKLTPKIDLNYFYEIQNNNLLIKGVMNSLFDDSLSPNENDSYFKILDPKSETFIYDNPEMFKFSFLGEKFMNQNEEFSESFESEKMLSMIFSLKNDFGYSKLYTQKIVFIKKGEEDFSLSSNLVGEGGIRIFWEDNLPKEVFILNSFGNLIEKKSLISGEFFWLNNLPSGVYCIQYQNKIQKITKI